MDFAFSDEQTQLRDGMQRFLRQAYPFDTYRKVAATPVGHSPEIWAQMCELQWPGLAFSEADGGLGCGPVELLLLTEQLGRALCVEPYLANVILAGQLLASVASPEQKQALLAPLLAGETQISLAYLETAGRHDPAFCETRAVATSNGYQLNGRKSLVLNGPNAKQFIVLARVTGDVRDESGLALFVVDAKADGLRQKHYAVLGGGVACELHLEGTLVASTQRLGSDDNAFQTLLDVLDLATAASCADAYGAMQALLEKTVEYLKTRKQFGMPLGTLQVLQHRMVDMFVDVQQSQSMILMAMLKLQEGDRPERRKAASACKAYLHQASKFVAQQAVQLHGGIGVTEELSIGHYFRRLTAFGNLFGDREHHLKRFAELTKSGSISS